MLGVGAGWRESLEEQSRDKCVALLQALTIGGPFLSSQRSDVVSQFV
jgi:hypothetical protein